jgi:hypothetical protein
MASPTPRAALDTGTFFQNNILPPSAIVGAKFLQPRLTCKKNATLAARKAQFRKCTVKRHLNLTGLAALMDWRAQVRPQRPG